MNQIINFRQYFPQLDVSQRVRDSLLNYDQAPPPSHVNVILSIQLLFVCIQTWCDEGAYQKTVMLIAHCDTRTCFTAKEKYFQNMKHDNWYHCVQIRNQIRRFCRVRSPEAIFVDSLCIVSQQLLLMCNFLYSDSAMPKDRKENVNLQ